MTKCNATEYNHLWIIRNLCRSELFFCVGLCARARVCAFVINIYFYVSLRHAFVCVHKKTLQIYMTIDKRNNKFNCMWSHNLLRRQFRPVCASFKNDIPTHTHTLKQIQTDFFNKNVYKRTHIYQWDDDERLFQFQLK